MWTKKNEAAFGLTSRMLPIFKTLAKKLTKDDMLLAAQELANPKNRNYGSNGFLFTKTPTNQSTGGTEITRAYGEVVVELVGLNAKEKLSDNEFIKNIQ